MTTEELCDIMSITLRKLYVSFKKIGIAKGSSFLLSVEDFGLVVCCIKRVDYASVNEFVSNNFADWRVFFITTEDNIMETKYKIIWALMRCGYMKWLRYNFPRQIKNVLLGQENLGNKIIEERLRIWNERPKFKFLINDNKLVAKFGIIHELNNDPSFFDFMPEEE